MTCVIKEGRVVHFDAYGSADVCARSPLQADTLFRLYSQTKPITVVAAFQLMERGLVAMQDPVAKYIPSFAHVIVESKGGSSTKPAARSLTVRDLLAHTSGVGFGPGFFYEPENDYEQVYVDVVGKVDRGEICSLADWCDAIAKLPLRFQPGADWGYGYSSDILGRVVEVASGYALDDYLKKEVLGPLGMSDTFFAVPADRAAHLSALYKREPWDGVGRSVKFVTVDPGGSGLTSDEARRVLDIAPDGLGGRAPSSSVFLEGRASRVVQGGGCICSVAGGLVSSLRDYARFGMMLLNDGELGGVRVLRPESVHLLARDWLNDFTEERREEPLWVWGTPGIGFSPLGQIGVEAADADRRVVGSQLHTVHWGGAGGSGYMLNWPHRLLVLTYTGCAYDTKTQKAMWRAAFGALRSGGAKVGRKRPLVETEAKGRSATSAKAAGRGLRAGRAALLRKPAAFTKPARGAAK